MLHIISWFICWMRRGTIVCDNSLPSLLGMIIGPSSPRRYPHIVWAKGCNNWWVDYLPPVVTLVETNNYPNIDASTRLSWEFFLVKSHLARAMFQKDKEIYMFLLIHVWHSHVVDSALVECSLDLSRVLSKKYFMLCTHALYNMVYKKFT